MMVMVTMMRSRCKGLTFLPDKKRQTKMPIGTFILFNIGKIFWYILNGPEEKTNFTSFSKREFDQCGSRWIQMDLGATGFKSGSTRDLAARESWRVFVFFAVSPPFLCIIIIFTTTIIIIIIIILMTLVFNIMSGSINTLIVAANHFYCILLRNCFTNESHVS